MIDWTVKLKSFDWEPHQLILFDLVCLFLETFSSRVFLRYASTNESSEEYYNLDLVGRLAEFLRVFLFDHRLRYERPDKFGLLYAIVSKIYPEDGSEYRMLENLLESIMGNTNKTYK